MHSQNLLLSLVKKDDLRITPSSPADICSADLLADRLHQILREIGSRARSLGFKLSFYDPNVGIWREVPSLLWRQKAERVASAGSLELAAITDSGILSDRLTVTTWKVSNGTLWTAKRDAKVKRSPYPADEVLPITEHAPTIDVVYTWVNDKDQEWLRSHSMYKQLEPHDFDRFEQNDELLYSIRSIEMFAPWVRNIVVFSNCAPPSWFAHSDRVRWVFHSEVVPDEYLPLFNSHAIETFIHWIPGLSEQFVYFNDDFFLSSPVRPEDFFTAYGQSVARLEPYGVLQHLRSLAAIGAAAEWQCAAVNSANALAKRGHVNLDQVHQHAPYACSRHLFYDIEKHYQSEFATTRASRFRSHADYSIMSYLYHHHALNKRLAVISDDLSFITRPNNYGKFIKQKMYCRLKFFCVNDGGGSTGHAGYTLFKKTFLAWRYGFKSRAEGTNL